MEAWYGLHAGRAGASLALSALGPFYTIAIGFATSIMEFFWSSSWKLDSNFLSRLSLW